jgi:hypothetical protein
MLVSLIAVVFSVISLEYVPAWTKDAEAEHMELASNQFSELAHTINSQVAFRANESISSPIQLGSKVLFAAAPSSGSLEIVPNKFGVALNSSSILGTTPVNRTRSIPPAGAAEASIASVSYFMLNVSAQLTNGRTATVHLTVNDPDGKAGEVFLNITLWKNQQGATVANLCVIDRNKSKIFNQIVGDGLDSLTSKGVVTNYRTNLLNPDFRFTEVLASTAAPYDMSLTLSVNGGSTAAANYDIIYEKYAESNLERTYECDTLSYSSDNSYFVNQDYAYDGSGVIVSQSIAGGNGSMFFQQPSVSIEKTGNTARMNFLIVNIITEGTNQASGNGVSSVKTRYVSSEATAFETHELNMTISTKYVNAWMEFFDRSFADAGFASGTDYTISQAGDSITINFKGKINGTERDIYFYLNYAVVSADIGAPAG